MHLRHYSEMGSLDFSRQPEGCVVRRPEVSQSKTVLPGDMIKGREAVCPGRNKPTLVPHTLFSFKRKQTVERNNIFTGRG